MGRSNAVPTFFVSAGAKFTVMRRAGTVKAELARAACTRSRLSLTAFSGSPTMVQLGNPIAASSSTITSDASMPFTAADRTLACISEAYGSTQLTTSSPYGTLFGSQHRHRIRVRGGARGDVCRDERHDCQEREDKRVRERIRRRDLEQHCPHAARGQHCRDEADGHADGRQRDAARHDHAEDAAPVGAECHANADFGLALADGVGDDAVDAEGAEQETQAAEEVEEDGEEARAARRPD